MGLVIFLFLMAIFILYQLDGLGRNELASRLTLNCMDAYVEPQKLRDITVTILDVGENNFFCLELPLHVRRVVLFRLWKMKFCRFFGIACIIEM